MSLRDYFAAAALQTLAPIINSMVGMSTWHSTWSHIPPNEIAQGCYVMADAMLLERQKLQGKTE
jgi:hypothetical protein